MDYLYAELPEIVYDPTNLTGTSPNGTVEVNVDNNKRVISATVIKTPHKLIVVDKNNPDKLYEFDGSQDVEVTIPLFDSNIKIEYKICEQEGYPHSDLKLGDAYLDITDGTGDKCYAPLIAGNNKTGDIQKIQSIQRVYTSQDYKEMPQDGKNYLVKTEGSNPYLSLYSFKNGFEKPQAVARVTENTIYVVLETGMLAMLDVSNIDDPKIVELTGKFDEELSKKQDNLVFDGEYDADTNKVVLQETTNTISMNLVEQGQLLGGRITNLESSLLIPEERLVWNDEKGAYETLTVYVSPAEAIQNISNEVNIIDDKVDTFGGSIQGMELEAMYFTDEDDTDNLQELVLVKKNGEKLTCVASIAPKGDRGIGISSIDKTSSDGLVDTYTITYTDGNTSTFLITNGKMGEDGKAPNIEIVDGVWYIDGVAKGSAVGEPGKTPTIGENGNWFINGVDTGVLAQGTVGSIGEQGPQGKTGYPIEIKEIYTTTTDLEANISTWSEGDCVVADGSIYLKLHDVWNHIVKLSEINLPNDLQVDETEGKIYLMSNGSKIGDGVKMLTQLKLDHESVKNEEDGLMYNHLMLLDNDGKLISEVTFLGGSGGGGGTGGTTSDSVRVIASTNTSSYYQTLISGSLDPVEIPFTYYVTRNGNISNEPVIVTYKMDVGNVGITQTITSFEATTYTTDTQDKKYVYFDLVSGSTYTKGTQLNPDTNELESINSGINICNISKYIAYGKTSTFYIEISTVDGKVSTTLNVGVRPINFALYSTFSDTFYKAIVDKGISIPYSVSGTGLDKQVLVTLYDVNNEELYSKTVNYGTGSSIYGDEGPLEITVAEVESTIRNTWEQGTYKIQLRCGVDTNNDGVWDLECTPLMFTIIRSKEDQSQNTVLFATDFNYETIKYGDILRIRYSVYDTNNDTANITMGIYTYTAKGERVELAGPYEDKKLPLETVQSRTINIQGSQYYSDKDNKVLYDKIYFEIKTTQTSTVYPITVLPLDTKYDIDINTTGLLAHIRPEGYTNQESNSDKLSTSFMYNNTTEVEVPVEMKNFNYIANGFFTDNDGINFVRLNGNARLNIHLPILATSYVYNDGSNEPPTVVLGSSGRTIEFRFRIRNSVNDRNPCISYMSANGTQGFKVLPTSAYLLNGVAETYDYKDDSVVIKNSKNVCNAHFCQEELIKLTFVIDPSTTIAGKNKQCLKIYLDGELAAIESGNTSFGNNVASMITCGSNTCELDLYSVTCYNRVLTDQQILNNFFADNPVISERIELFDKNNVFDTEGLRANYVPTQSANYDPSKLGVDVNKDTMLIYTECQSRVPCILFEGTMPQFKGDKQKVAVTITKPDGQGGVTTVVQSLDKKYDSDIGADVYLNDIDVQGTSSAQLYPRYNYKVKLKGYKNKTDNTFAYNILENKDNYSVENWKVYINPDTLISETNDGNKWIGESTLCWKADMMSPDHANTVNGIWFNDLFSDIPPAVGSTTNYHQTVYGFRCLAFHKVGDEYRFLGDGCLNNDKSNSKTFGLENSGDDIKNSTAPVTKCQKWEFLDNSPDICNFKSHEFFKKANAYETTTDDSGNTTVNKDKVLYTYDVVQDALESCYPDQGDVQKETSTETVPDGQHLSIPLKYIHLQLLYLWVCERANFWQDADLKKEDTTTMSAYYDNYKITDEITGEDRNVQNLYEYRKAVFTEEFTKHFNLDNMAEYWVALEVTGLVDNHAKNMFLTCYDTTVENIILDYDNAPSELGEKYKELYDAGNNSGALDYLLSYIKSHANDTSDFNKLSESWINWQKSTFTIWYTNAYDLDSCYGVDNTGDRKLNYSFMFGDKRGDGGKACTGEESVLWNMFRQCFSTKIGSTFRSMTVKPVQWKDGSAGHTALTLEHWKHRMITQNSDVVPAVITNEDSIFKYVMPWQYGYYKNNTYAMEEDGEDHLYLVKSNRKLDDTNFMEKRLNLLASRYTDTKIFANIGNAIQLQANKTITNENLELKIAYNQKLYGKIMWDSNQTNQITGSNRSDDDGYQYFNIPTGTFASGARYFNFYGAKQMTHLEGLCHLNISQISLQHCNNLRKLYLSDGNVQNENTDLSAISVSSCSMLEELDIRYYRAITSLDLSSNTMLKVLKANGCSQLTSIDFADGGNLTHIYLPASLENLTLIEQSNLEEVYLDSIDNLKLVNIKGNYGKLFLWNSSTSTYEEITLLDILYKTCIESNQITGLRLENVTLDLTNRTDWFDFIELLAGRDTLGNTIDNLKNTWIDQNGKEAEDKSNPSTMYPELRVTLILGNEHEDSITLASAEDLLMTEIIGKYPSITLQAPSPSINYNTLYDVTNGVIPISYCKYYQIATVCSAAKAGILEDIYGVCDIRITTETVDGVERVRGWWQIGDSLTVRRKDDNSKNLTFRIADFWQASDVNNEYIPVQLISNTLLTDAGLPYVDKESKKQYIVDVSISGVSGDVTNATVDYTSEDVTSVKSLPSVCYNTQVAREDIVITAKGRCYISELILDGNVAHWYLDNRKNGSKDYVDSAPNYYLDQKDVGASSESYRYTLSGEKFEWLPLASNPTSKLIFDTTQGNINIYNTNPNEQYDNLGRAFELCEGAKIIIPGTSITESGMLVQLVITYTTPDGGYWNSNLAQQVDAQYTNCVPEWLQNMVKLTKVAAAEGALSDRVNYRNVYAYAPSYNEVGGGSNSSMSLFYNEFPSNNSLDYFQADDYRIIRDAKWHTRSCGIQRGYTLKVSPGGSLVADDCSAFAYVVFQINI